MRMKRRYRRSWMIASTVAVVAALMAPVAASASPPTTDQLPATAGLQAGSTSDGKIGMENAARAGASYQALQTYLGSADGSGLFHEQYPAAPGDNQYSYEWPFSQAHIAIADLANQPGATGQRYDGALRSADVAQDHYWKAEGGTTGLPGYASYPLGAYGSGGDFFYDDNEWVGLLDVQRYLTDGNAADLARARAIFDLVLSGWDSNPDHPAAGGVFWTQAPWSSDRNTVSNMPGAELGLRLFQITGRRSYLDSSLKMYQWTNKNLQRPDGLFNDHVDLLGNVESSLWSYNQGVPVGVNVLLYEVTHDRRYLSEAQRIASAAAGYFGAQGRLLAQPAFFNSIYLKNLLLLESVTGGSTYRKTMQSYADRVWTGNRDPLTGLFHFDSSSTQLLEQAAMVQIYAVLNWSPTQRHTLY